MSMLGDRSSAGLSSNSSFPQFTVGFQSRQKNRSIMLILKFTPGGRISPVLKGSLRFTCFFSKPHDANALIYIYPHMPSSYNVRPQDTLMQKNAYYMVLLKCAKFMATLVSGLLITSIEAV